MNRSGDEFLQEQQYLRDSRLSEKSIRHTRTNNSVLCHSQMDWALLPIWVSQKRCGPEEDVPPPQKKFQLLFTDRTLGQPELKGGS